MSDSGFEVGPHTEMVNHRLSFSQLGLGLIVVSIYTGLTEE